VSLKQSVGMRVSRLVYVRRLASYLDHKTRFTDQVADVLADEAAANQLVRHVIDRRQRAIGQESDETR
jgi:predicted component of type VI protein secretion system